MRLAHKSSSRAPTHRCFLCVKVLTHTVGRHERLTLDKEVTLVDINDIVKITTLPRNLVNNVTDFLRTAEDVKYLLAEETSKSGDKM